jgi:hypothetical protein
LADDRVDARDVHEAIVATPLSKQDVLCRIWHEWPSAGILVRGLT